MRDTIHIGAFAVKGGKLMVTDPCYKRGTWCQSELCNVLDGRWLASIEVSNDEETGSWGDRVSKISIRHSDGIPKSFKTIENIGVDSGQAGFFCESKYPKIDIGDFGDTDTFYGKVCKLTSGDRQAGVIDFGAVSSSGYGDGMFVCNYSIDADDKIVQAEIVFID